MGRPVHTINYLPSRQQLFELPQVHAGRGHQDERPPLQPALPLPLPRRRRKWQDLRRTLREEGAPPRHHPTHFQLHLKGISIST